MVQPKTPPLSIRPGDQRLARIDAYAKDHHLSRHLAILLMLDEGYRSLTKPAPALKEILASGSGKPPISTVKQNRKILSRLKGEWKAP